MKNALTRRQFLRRTSATAAALWVGPYVTSGLRAASPNDTVLHASFGTGGQAIQDLNGFTRTPAAKLVAVADIDLDHAAALKRRFPDIKVYQDWRVLLDKEKSIDSVNVTVPDHMHAVMAMSAMQLGKNVYCQKPLTHDIYETRKLTEFARGKKFATQMGIQIHSSGGNRQFVQMIQDGVIGKIKEVHAWSSKKWGGATVVPPDQDNTVPANFNWDWWLGTAATRPFIGGAYYHPGNWRKRLDFGTGTFGDMGCHIYDPVYKALELTAPVSVRSEGLAPVGGDWALNATVHYVFPGTKYCADDTVKVTWYDGDAKPPKEVQALIGDNPLPREGSVSIGTKGVMVLPHQRVAQLFPAKDFADYQRPKLDDQNHWTQFIEACRGNGKTSTPFDYAGPLSETVLLGSVACRFPQTTLEWNARDLKFTNTPEANQYLRRTYRKGWEVKGLA